MRRSPKEGRSKKNTRGKRLENKLLKKEPLDSWINYYDRVTQATPRTVFTSYSLNFSSKPPTIVISFLKSD